MGMYMVRPMFIASLLLTAAWALANQPEPIGSTSQPVPAPFTWKMAGALVKWDDPLRGTAAKLLDNHFSYIGQYAVNGCENNDEPYSCERNGCKYPGRPYAELPNYTQLRDWMVAYQDAGLYVGLWGQSYYRPEAEAHCMAEVLNTMRNTYGVTADFFIVAAEKPYEENFGQTRRFVDEFNRTISFSLAKAESPECRIAIDFAYWINNGFDIMPQAYWNDTGTPPRYCLEQGCLNFGVPKSRCHVMLDGYRHGTPNPWSSYAASIKEFQDQVDAPSEDTGFSIWLTLNESEWDQWGPLIEDNRIAVYDGSPPSGGS